MNHINKIVFLNVPHRGTSIASENPNNEGILNAIDLITGDKKIDFYAKQWGAYYWAQLDGNQLFGRYDFSVYHIASYVSGHVYKRSFDFSSFAKDILALRDYATAVGLGEDSEIVQSLFQEGHPVRPMDNQKIPSIVLYSKTSSKLLSKAVKYTLDNISCGPFKFYGLASECRSMLDQTYNQFLKIMPDLNPWVNNSDLVVNEYSARGDGIFARNSKDSKVIYMGEMAHMSIPGVEDVSTGARKYIYEAIINEKMDIQTTGNIDPSIGSSSGSSMESNIDPSIGSSSSSSMESNSDLNIVPTILSPLLLN
jgi:hypothetical protein